MVDAKNKVKRQNVLRSVAREVCDRLPEYKMLLTRPQRTGVLTSMLRTLRNEETKSVRKFLNARSCRIKLDSLQRIDKSANGRYKRALTVVSQQVGVASDRTVGQYLVTVFGRLEAYLLDPSQYYCCTLWANCLAVLADETAVICERPNRILTYYL